MSIQVKFCQYIYTIKYGINFEQFNTKITHKFTLQAQKSEWNIGLYVNPSMLISLASTLSVTVFGMTFSLLYVIRSFHHDQGVMAKSERSSDTCPVATALCPDTKYWVKGLRVQRRKKKVSYKFSTEAGLLIRTSSLHSCCWLKLCMYPLESVLLVCFNFLQYLKCMPRTIQNIPQTARPPFDQTHFKF